MPVRLGDIEFGLGSDDRALDRSMQKLRRFGTTVERAARSTAKGARKVESDFRRQERAILAALQTILKFNREARSVGTKGAAGVASTRAAKQASTAFNQLTNEMTKGRASALTFDRTMGRFNATLGTSQRELRRFKIAQKNAALETQFFGVSIRDFASASVIALGPLSGLGAQIQAVASIAARTSFIVAGFIATVTLAGVAIAKIGSASVTTAIEMDKVNARMLAITGSTAAATVQFEDLRELADATGLNFKDLAQSFTRLQTAAQGTGLEGAAVEQMFEDLSFAAAKFRLPAEDVKGVMKAIEQIMSKGTVTAEEMRQQLGDRLPGAFNRAADAIGVTTVEFNKMLKKGEVMAVDFLPKFTKEIRRAFGAESVNRVDSLQASINRLDNAMLFFNTSFDQAVGVSKVYRAALISLTDIVDALASNMDILIASVGALTFGFIGLVGPGILRGLVSMFGFLKKIGGFLIGAASAATGFGLALKLGLRFILGAGAGLALFATSAQSAVEAQNKLIDRIDAFIAVQEDAKRTALDATRSLISEVVNAGEIARLKIKSVERILENLEKRRAGAIELGVAVTITDTMGAVIARRQAQLKALRESQVALAEQSGRLGAKEREEAAKQAVLDANRIAAQNAISESVRQTIDRLEQEAAAIREGVVAVALLKQEFKELDVLARLEIDLRKSVKDPGVIAAELKRARDAFMALQDASRSAAFAKGLDVISDMNALAVATGQGEGALKRFNQQLANTNAAKKFGDALGVATKSAAIGAFGARVYTRALEDLRDAQDRISLAALDKQIERIRLQAEAMKEGKGAVDALNAAFAREDAIKAFSVRVLSSTDNIELARAKIEAYTTTVDGLADVKVENVIKGITKAVELLNQEASGIIAGGESFKQFQQAVEDNKFIDTYRQKLIAAGEEIEEVEKLLQPLIKAMERLRDVTKQVGVDDAIVAVRNKVVDLGLELKALQGGKDVFTAFQDAGKVTEALAVFEKQLVADGIQGAELVTQLEPLRLMLLKVAEAGRANKGKEKDPFGALADVEQTIKRIRLEIDALEAGPSALDALQRQFDIEDELDSVAKKLDKQGVSALVAATKVDELRRALIDLAATETKIVKLEALDKVDEDLDRMIAKIVAMQTGVPSILKNLLKSFERTDAIEGFISFLDDAGVEQAEINKLTEEYVKLLDKLEEIAPAFQRQVEAMRAVEQALLDIEHGTSEIFAQMVLDAEFSFQSLVELGRRTVQQLLSEFFRLAIIKPLLDDITNPGSVGGGGGGGGFLDTVLKFGSALIGGALGGGGAGFAGVTGTGFQPGSFGGMAKGGVLGGPTLINQGGGDFAIGGEAGDEGLLPLIRNSRGDLSVNAVGGGGSPTMIFNIATPNPSGFFRAKSEMAAMASQFVGNGSRNM